MERSLSPNCLVPLNFRRKPDGRAQGPTYGILHGSLITIDDSRTRLSRLFDSFEISEKANARGTAYGIPCGVSIANQVSKTSLRLGSIPALYLAYPLQCFRQTSTHPCHDFYENQRDKAASLRTPWGYRDHPGEGPRHD